MKIYEEINLSGFEFWAGAKDTAAQLTEEEFDEIEIILEEMYPDGISDTTLNDLFWFENDWIAEMLGYSDWEELEASREE